MLLGLHQSCRDWDEITRAPIEAESAKNLVTLLSHTVEMCLATELETFDLSASLQKYCKYFMDDTKLCRFVSSMKCNFN